MTEITFGQNPGSFTGASVTGSIRCMGEVRWALVSNAHERRQTLQQLFEVVEYRDGKPYERREEWRDVPVVSTP